MTPEQLEALMEYIRAVAQREAVICAHGTDNHWHNKNELEAANELRRLFIETPRNPDEADDTPRTP